MEPFTSNLTTDAIAVAVRDDPEFGTPVEGDVESAPVPELPSTTEVDTAAPVLPALSDPSPIICLARTAFFVLPLFHFKSRATTVL